MPTNNTLLTTTDDVSGFLPPEYGNLIVQPVQTGAVAYQVAENISTGSSEFHVPIVGKDAGAGWVAEGEEIAVTEGKYGEATVIPKKVAGLSVISRELANDSSPAASKIVGDGLARSIARQVDIAFFGSTTVNGPIGLEGVPGINEVEAPTAWTNLDPFAEAIAEAEQEGAVITSFVANPEDAKVLATLKDQADSNRPLLGVDPTKATQRLLQGVPLLVSPAVTPGTVWGIPRDRVLVITREGTEIAVDESVFFTSDRVAVRAIMRVGFAYPHAEAVQKITLASE
ncbi:phage major capsid protein [Actinomycetaceae bacterium WB03_NA08]|uniref:Phage major capsid protein n=1 Tax=Scrofimicrobium canadense TaxID=2652290 RepID=A0A6N7W8E8_9ACTO|nr:phage major capsid protein [Scrofimicrobium canadense]MSS84546.1 phage major capsid protein [Scrofimicrobium canadense]